MERSFRICKATAAARELSTRRCSVEGALDGSSQGHGRTNGAVRRRQPSPPGDMLVPRYMCVPHGGSGLWLAPRMVEETPRPIEMSTQTETVAFADAAPLSELRGDTDDLLNSPGITAEHSPMSPPPTTQRMRRVSFGHSLTPAPLFVDEDEDVSDGSYGIVDDGDPESMGCNRTDCGAQSGSGSPHVVQAARVEAALPNFVQSILRDPVRVDQSSMHRWSGATKADLVEDDLRAALAMLEAHERGHDVPFTECDDARSFGVVPVVPFEEVEL